MTPYQRVGINAMVIPCFLPVMSGIQQLAEETLHFDPTLAQQDNDECRLWVECKSAEGASVAFQCAQHELFGITHGEVDSQRLSPSRSATSPCRFASNTPRHGFNISGGAVLAAAHTRMAGSCWLRRDSEFRQPGVM
ncbi:hypothetical protein SRHO_G00126780 [Serrasalmus rhombeus]